MDYSNLTPEISALCRTAMQEEFPGYEFQAEENFGTVHELEKLEMEKDHLFQIARSLALV